MSKQTYRVLFDQVVTYSVDVLAESAAEAIAAVAGEVEVKSQEVDSSPFMNVRVEEDEKR